MHGCYNREPFKETLLVQAGWTEDGRRIMKEIPFRMSMNCEYDLKQTDGECGDCKWRTSND